MDNTSIQVQVVYAQTDSQWFGCTLSLSPTATVADALMHSGILQLHHDWVLEKLPVGIYGHRCTLDQSLHDKDRVEIYRELIIDPRVSRKNRVNNVRDARKWRQINKNK